MRLTYVAISVKAIWRMEHSDATITVGGRGMQQPKIPVSAIQDVLRAVEEAPDCDETEVAKVEAMRRLIPALRTMQAKGYGLDQIAKLLCDRGIAVTEGGLKQYLHRLGSRRVTEPPRAGKRDRSATGSPGKPLGSSSRSSDVAATAPAKSQPPHVDAAVTTPTRNGSAAASVTAASQSPAITPPATSLTPSRSGFVVRPDRKVI